jgi:hypothetical protein
VLLIPEIVKKLPPGRESVQKWRKCRERIEKLPHRLFGYLSVVCFIIAGFQLWHDQRVKMKDDAVFLRPAEIAPKADIGSADIFPIGEPLSVNFAWTVFGQKPATNAFQDGKAYLEVNTSSSTQQRIVKDFQVGWEEEVQRVKNREHSVVFPGDKAETFWMTYQGPVISESDKLDIKFSRKFVFIIGAARFTDALGRHEAHLCRWLEAHTNGIYGTVAWHDCELWISPIDIE